MGAHENRQSRDIKNQPAKRCRFNASTDDGKTFMSLAAYGGGGAKALEEKDRQQSLGVEVYSSENL